MTTRGRSASCSLRRTAKVSLFGVYIHRSFAAGNTPLSLPHLISHPLAAAAAAAEYGQVLRMLGNGRLEAHCFDGVRRLCHIRGKMRKRVWVNAGDIVLISLREFQDNKGDVIAKYRYNTSNTSPKP